MTDNEYEILPHQLLEDLKYDVEALKKKLNEPDGKANELILEIESLKESTHELNVIFQKALEETKKDDDYTQKFKDINKRLNEVVSQNETIAKGMIAIADKLDKFMKGAAPKPVPKVKKAPVQHMMGPPSMPGTRTAPQPGPYDLPPPPPRRDEESKGLFG